MPAPLQPSRAANERAIVAYETALGRNYLITGSLVISLYFDYAKCWRIEKESGDRAIADALGSSDVFDDDESRRMKKSKRTVEKAISLGSI